MTEAQKLQYLKECRDATPAPPTFKHWESPAQEAEHLCQVEQAQREGAPF